MTFILVNKDNIETEHICCAITEKKGENTVSSKKKWLQERFDDGLVFLKLNQRGKVFIEYMPAEKCFAPISAPDYMYISCFWVSGKFKGCGYANELLQACINDAKAKGKKGIVVLGSEKKMHFLSDPKYFKYKGFKVCDRTNPSFELLYYPFEDDSCTPEFKAHVKKGTIDYDGVVIYYSNGCPHTEKYVSIEKQVLERYNLPYKIIKLETVEAAQNAPVPCTNYAIFMNGIFVTSEVLTEKKLMQYLDAHHLL